MDKRQKRVIDFLFYSFSQNFVEDFEENTAGALVLHLKEKLGTLAFLPGQLTEEMAHAGQSRRVTV